jgi:hypothetical protein
MAETNVQVLAQAVRNAGVVLARCLQPTDRITAEQAIAELLPILDNEDVLRAMSATTSSFPRIRG